MGGVIEQEEIVIVGAGIAGLALSLGLHRQGLRSIVLEAWDGLRVTGFAFTTWSNAWKALDALGIGDTLRQHHLLINGIVTTSITTGLPTSVKSFETKGLSGNHEIRCVRRKALLEALMNELPPGTVRFSSKVVNIQEYSGNSNLIKLVHLADGTIYKAKVVIGCDGINSVVAKWLGWSKSTNTGRSAMRGYAHFENCHEFDPKFMQFFGVGIRAGFLTCDQKDVYWFLTYNSSTQTKEMEDDPAKMKQFILTEPGVLADKMRPVIEHTETDTISSAPLRYRNPWELLTGNISKGNVCVAGDALHPMTPDIGQGGCSALEDAVVLSRCLSQALSQSNDDKGGDGDEHKKINLALEKYAKERRWRSIDLIATAYMVGWIQQSGSKLMGFLRDKLLSDFLAGLLQKKSNFDCGKL